MVPSEEAAGPRERAVGQEGGTFRPLLASLGQPTRPGLAGRPVQDNLPYVDSNCPPLRVSSLLWLHVG